MPIVRVGRPFDVALVHRLYMCLLECLLIVLCPIHKAFRTGVAAPNGTRISCFGVCLFSQGTDRENRGVFIEGSDVRAKRMARKAGSLIIFIVDASGSMALNRMNAAKGAAMSLLQEAYQSRDKICIIPFQVCLGFNLRRHTSAHRSSGYFSAPIFRSLKVSAWPPFFYLRGARFLFGVFQFNAPTCMYARMERGESGAVEGTHSRVVNCDF